MGTEPGVISYRQEILRKLIHLSSLWIPIVHLFHDSRDMLWILGIAGIVVIGTDLARIYVAPVRTCFMFLFGGILREHELTRGKLTGASYVLAASFITVALFEPYIAIPALFTLMLSDTAAALVGRKWGTTKLAGKSLEGCLAFFATSMIVLVVIAGWAELPWQYLLGGTAGALAATVTELYSKRFRTDDNFSIPLAYGAAFMLVV